MHTRIFPPFFSRPLRMLSLSRICCYSLIVVFSLSWKWSQTLIVCARAQAAILRPSGHSVKEIGKFFEQDGTLGEQIVEKIVLRRQTKKRTTVCVNQCCSKINRESKVQTEQFNKEDCQESSAVKYRNFEHIVCGGTRPGKDGRLASAGKYLCWAKSKARLRFAKKHAKLTAEY